LEEDPYTLGTITEIERFGYDRSTLLFFPIVGE
jgi:hypothetical protein